MLGNRDAGYSKGQRYNFKQVIAKRSDLVKFSDGRMVSPASVTVIHAGQVLARVTESGRLTKYMPGASDGSGTPVGVLAQTTEMGPGDDSTLVVVITGGQLYKDLLIGLDAGAIESLNAKTIVEDGVNILDF